MFSTIDVSHRPIDQSSGPAQSRRILASRTMWSGALLCGLLTVTGAVGHGTTISPTSRVYRVFQSNPENPNFPLAAQAVAMDGTQSYYSWNEVSRNIPEAVQAGLPAGFDYSPWIPDGQLASAGRVDPDSPDYPRTHAGLDQVSADWPTTAVAAGETITVDFFATAPHDPSVWDVWMTTPDWDPSMPLTWDRMEFLFRPTVQLDAGHYTFDLTIPADRSGHHVLWIAWQRDDPVGEVFVSTSDLMITGAPCPGDVNADGAVGIGDLLSLLGGWGGNGPGADLAAPFDVIDTGDLISILAAWGPC
ncbi:MAG: lytic polysaccharide monooxygenase [Phycisphaerales bacterium]